jgi:hypothetical protein
MLRIPYAFLRQAGLPFACPEFSKGARDYRSPTDSLAKGPTGENSRMVEVVFAVICFLARVLDPRSRSILSGDGAPKGGPERRA